MKKMKARPVDVPYMTVDPEETEVSVSNPNEKLLSGI